MACSEFSAEGLVEQGFFQRLQRGELLLVDGGEALGFFRERFQLFNGCRLKRQRRRRNGERLQVAYDNVIRCRTELLGGDPSGPIRAETEIQKARVDDLAQLIDDVGSLIGFKLAVVEEYLSNVRSVSGQNN